MGQKARIMAVNQPSASAATPVGFPYHLESLAKQGARRCTLLIPPLLVKLIGHLFY